MKVAILGEGDLDEIAARILIDGILGQPTEPVAFTLRTRRGWPGVRYQLPALLKHLHYRTDAEALVVVADSDDSPIHQPAHEQPGQTDSQCRHCSLREVAGQELARLTPLPGRAPVKIAIGIAIPTIEAWFLCGNDHRASEAVWLTGGNSMRGATYRENLKRALHSGSALPKAQRAQIEARRLAQDISLLENHFPAGFGSLVRVLKSW